MRAPDKGFWTIINEDLKSNIQQGNREQITCRFGLMFRSILMQALFLSITTVSSNYWSDGEHYSRKLFVSGCSSNLRRAPEDEECSHIIALFPLLSTQIDWGRNYTICNTSQINTLFGALPL